MGGETEAEPEVAPPVPNPPAAVQEVAPVEDQVRVEDWPLMMVVGEAESVAVGGLEEGFASEQEAFVPPAEPWQVQVYAEEPFTLFTLVPAVQE